MQRIMFLNILVFVKLHSFNGNPLNDFKEWGCICNISHISAANYPRTLNLVSN